MLCLKAAAVLPGLRLAALGHSYDPKRPCFGGGELFWRF